MNREEAWKFLTEYNKEAFHLQHAVTVENIMRELATKLGFAEEAEHWAIVGLLHDLDFEMYPEEHCVKCVEIMRARGVEESIVRSTASHGYGLTASAFEPEHTMEKVLFAIDELSGLIGAAALMRPSKSVQDMELKSLKKKFKDKKFAAGCNRDVIASGAEKLGWTLDELLENTLEAMRATEENVKSQLAGGVSAC